MEILTVINSLILIYILVKRSKFYIRIKKQVSERKKRFIGYKVILWKRLSIHSSKGVFALKLYFLNEDKINLKEDVDNMINNYSKQNILQTLTAKFSWLKTWDEVREFEKNYSVVDPYLVSKLVTNFKPKK